VALAAPERVRRLVLVSTSAGIEDAAERRARREADRRLAVELETAPFEEFIERWRAQPLFAGDPPAVAELARADQRRNRPDALAAVLRGIGAGEMEPLWERLQQLTMPVTVVVGDRDAKFRELGERMVHLLRDATLTVIAGGHDLPRENPSALAGVID
jgi:pimeloyl-ACP methyl ester carboxylesterase